MLTRPKACFIQSTADDTCEPGSDVQHKFWNPLLLPVWVTNKNSESSFANNAWLFSPGSYFAPFLYTFTQYRGPELDPKWHKNKEGRRDKWRVSKDPGTDLGARLAVAMRGLPKDPSRAQVQGFNKDDGITERGTHFESPIPMWSLTQHSGPFWPRISFLFHV